MKRTSRVKTGTDRAFADFQNAVRGAQRPSKAVHHFRRTLPTELFERASRWLKRTSFRGAPSSIVDFPRHYAEVRRVPDPEPTTLERELLWAAAALSQHSEAIERFIPFAEKFSKYVLASDVESATETLDALEQALGKSIWVVSNRIALLARAGGTPAQKALVATIRSESAIGELPYLAYFISGRNETAFSLPSFRNMFRRIASDEPDSPHKAYLSFHVLPMDPPRRQHIPAILAFESTSPVVDYYETFVRVCRLLARERPAEFMSAGAGAIALLAKAVRDRRLDALACLSTGDFSYLDGARELDGCGFDEFLSGNFDASLHVVERARAMLPASFELIELAARAGVAGGRPIASEGSLLSSELVWRMASILRKDHQANDNWLQLSKLAVNFSYLPWAGMLAEFCQQEYQASPTKEAANAALPNGIPPEVIFSPYSSVLSHKLAAGYLKKCQERQDSGLTQNYFRLLSGDNSAPQISLDRRHEAFFAASAAEDDGDYESALEALNRLASETNPYFTPKALRHIPKVMLRAGKVEECVNYITSMFLAETDLGPLLPIRDTVRSIDGAVAHRLRGSLSLSILYDIYARHFGEDEGGARQFAYEDFLLAQGLTRPSQLRDSVGRLPQAQIIYYLRNICVPQVMDVSTDVFQGSNDLEEERMAVCQLLADIDPARRAEYQTEITEISRRQLIKLRTKEIEQSKIYVDIESVRQLATDNLRESFQRYQALPEISAAQINTVVDAIRKIAADPKSVIKINLPADEKNAVLANLVADIRDLFVSSNEHGLDGYLSVRIRHGTLAGELRSPIEAAHLLIEKERVSSGYGGNTYWAEFFDTGDEVEIGKRLAKFSADFDGLLNKLRGEWIQIRKSSDDNGIFDFTVTDNQIALIAATTNADTSFEQFLDFTFATLLQKLEADLVAMRQRIVGEAKAMFDGLLENLRLDIEKITKRSQVTELDSAIKEARIELSNALNRIAGWFQLPKRTSATPFPIEDAVTIAIQSVRRFHPDYPFNPRVTVSTGVALPGLLLPGVVDVCIIVFENIVRYAATQGEPEIQVEVTANDDWIHFKIENEIGPGVYCDATVQRVRTLKEAVDRGEYKRSVAAEGGTGFHKIWKIIANDIDPRARLDFGFRDDRSFFVELAVARKIQP